MGIRGLKEIKELLKYDPVTGAITWRKTNIYGYAGCNAISKVTALACVRVDTSEYLAATKIAYMHVKNARPLTNIYVIDGDRYNMAWANLTLDRSKVTTRCTTRAVRQAPRIRVVSLKWSKPAARVHVTPKQEYFDFMGVYNGL